MTLLSAAAEDHALPSSAVRVLAFLLPRLTVEPSPVKIWGVALAVGLDRGTVASSLDALSERGYLVAGASVGMVCTYSLPLGHASDYAG